MLWWVLLWVVLFLGAGLALGLLGLMLWRKATALTREVGEATERMTAELAALNDVADPARDDPSLAPPTRASTRNSKRDRRASRH